MKKFICFSTRQQHLSPVQYVAVDNQKLHFGTPGDPPRETAFPILPVLNGYTDSGEEIELIVLTEEYEKSKENFEILSGEVKALCEEKNVTLRNGRITQIMIPYEDGIDAQLLAFQKIIDRIEDEDELHACITYGSKPGEIVELMALRYARMIKKNTFIACVAYGNVDFKNGKAWIYDETALAQLDDIMRVLSQNGDKNPKETIQKILEL